MTDFQLGQRVAYSTQIIRRGSRPGEFDGPDKAWSTKPWPGMQDHEGGEGIIIGQRTLTEGKIEYNYDDPAIYIPTRHFTAYMVAFDLRRKPVYVLPEHITPK